MTAIQIGLQVEAWTGIGRKYSTVLQRLLPWPQAALKPLELWLGVGKTSAPRPQAESGLTKIRKLYWPRLDAYRPCSGKTVTMRTGLSLCHPNLRLSEIALVLHIVLWSHPGKAAGALQRKFCQHSNNCKATEKMVILQMSELCKEEAIHNVCATSSQSEPQFCLTVIMCCMFDHAWAL